MPGIDNRVIEKSNPVDEKMKDIKAIFDRIEEDDWEDLFQYSKEDIIKKWLGTNSWKLEDDTKIDIIIDELKSLMTNKSDKSATLWKETQNKLILMTLENLWIRLNDELTKDMDDDFAEKVLNAIHWKDIIRETLNKEFTKFVNNLDFDLEPNVERRFKDKYIDNKIYWDDTTNKTLVATLSSFEKIDSNRLVNILKDKYSEFLKDAIAEAAAEEIAEAAAEEIVEAAAEEIAEAAAEEIVEAAAEEIVEAAAEEIVEVAEDDKVFFVHKQEIKSGDTLTKIVKEFFPELKWKDLLDKIDEVADFNNLTDKRVVILWNDIKIKYDSGMSKEDYKIHLEGKAAEAAAEEVAEETAGVEAAAEEAAGVTEIVTVTRGDTLEKIVKRNFPELKGTELNNKIDEVAKDNNISNKNLIFLGQKINITKCKVDEVVEIIKWDTIDYIYKITDRNLWEIVLKYLQKYNINKINTLVKEFKEKNSSFDERKMRIGQSIDLWDGITKEVSSWDTLSKIIFETFVKKDYNYKELLAKTITINKKNDSNFNTNRLKYNQVIKLPVLNK